ncbi:MAG: Ig-like domain-containing protein, partial [Acidimicrobiia bacterium]
MASADIEGGDTSTPDDTTTTSTTVAEEGGTPATEEGSVDSSDPSEETSATEETTSTEEPEVESTATEESSTTEDEGSPVEESTVPEEDPPAEETLETAAAEEAASEPSPNQAPVAVNDSLTILLDQTVTVDISANDSDPDGDPLALVAVSAAAHGTASVTEGGILYAPNPGYKGYEVLTYTISDGEFEASATLTIQVDPPPVAVADTATTTQDHAVVIDVLANDTDADGDPITVANVTDPLSGTAVVNLDQTITYTPNPGFKGFDTFTYTANDGTFDSIPGTVTVLVQAQTRLPADIPFMIDESGSMGDDIAAVKNNVDFIASQLEVDLDPRYALVGFGANSSHTTGFGGTADGHPHTHTDFTDKEGFKAALDQLVASGGFEPGVETTTFAMTALTGYRLGAGVCAVLITDEDSDYITEEAVALTAAKTALDARDAVWFGVVDPNESGTAGEYGPNAGSLSEHTGGEVFAINDFRADPEPVLDAILQGCVTALVQGINLTPPEASNLIGDPHTVLAIVRDNTGAPVVGVEVTFRITAGPNSGQVAVVATDTSGEASFTYTSS